MISGVISEFIQNKEHSEFFAAKTKTWPYLLTILHLLRDLPVPSASETTVTASLNSSQEFYSVVILTVQVQRDVTN